MKWPHLLPLIIHPLCGELWGSWAWKYWGEKLQPCLCSLCVYSLSSHNASPRGATCAGFWPALRPADCYDSSLINGGFEMKMIYSSEVWGSRQSWLTVSTGQRAMLERCAIRGVCREADISPRTPPVEKLVRKAKELRRRCNLRHKKDISGPRSDCLLLGASGASDSNLKLNTERSHLCLLCGLIDMPLIHSPPTAHADDKPMWITASIFTHGLVILKH